MQTREVLDCFQVSRNIEFDSPWLLRTRIFYHYRNLVHISNFTVAPSQRRLSINKMSNCYSALLAMKKVDKLSGKYKTRICVNWATGHCEFGSACVFAHGRHELRQTALPANYKTRFCLNQETEGYCQYGLYCQFKHREDSPLSKRILWPPDKRLPVFLALEKGPLY